MLTGPETDGGNIPGDKLGALVGALVSLSGRGAIVSRAPGAGANDTGADVIGDKVVPARMGAIVTGATVGASSGAMGACVRVGTVKVGAAVVPGGTGAAAIGVATGAAGAGASVSPNGIGDFVTETFVGAADTGVIVVPAGMGAVVTGTVIGGSVAGANVSPKGIGAVVIVSFPGALVEGMNVVPDGMGAAVAVETGAEVTGASGRGLGARVGTAFRSPGCSSCLSAIRSWTSNGERPSKRSLI